MVSSGGARTEASLGAPLISRLGQLVACRTVIVPGRPGYLGQRHRVI